MSRSAPAEDSFQMVEMVPSKGRERSSSISLPELSLRHGWMNIFSVSRGLI